MNDGDDQSEPGDRGVGGSESGDRGVGGSESPGLLRRFLDSDSEAVAFLREVLGSIAAVLLVGLLLFAISGLWPPMVAVESGSMNPHLVKGDLVFVMEEHRLTPPAAHAETGVVTHRTGNRTGYSRFDAPGDVIVYQKNGNPSGTPIIHRAMFWVNESEDWYDKADQDAIGRARGCAELPNCPAPHDGFITKGDNDRTNQRYDQVTRLSPPVREEWVVGTAELRIPYLGWVRLFFGQVTAAPAPNASVPSPAPSASVSSATSPASLAG